MDVLFGEQMSSYMNSEWVDKPTWTLKKDLIEAEDSLVHSLLRTHC